MPNCFGSGSVYQLSFDLGGRTSCLSSRRWSTELDETAAFYVRQGSQRLCLYRVDSRHLMREHIRPGDRRPMDQSATAQVLKIFAAPNGNADHDLSKFPLFTRGVTDLHTAALAMPVFREGMILAGSLDDLGSDYAPDSGAREGNHATTPRSGYSAIERARGGCERICHARSQDGGGRLTYEAGPKRLINLPAGRCTEKIAADLSQRTFDSAGNEM